MSIPVDADHELPGLLSWRRSVAVSHWHRHGRLRSATADTADCGRLGISFGNSRDDFSPTFGRDQRARLMAPNISSLSGGSLLLAWQLKDKTVLIIGGGEVASGRIESVLVADALVTIISPLTGLHPLTRRFVDADRITYHDRVFSGPDDLVGVDMVLTAIDDVEKSREICALCRERKIPINVADIPKSCDFYFGSQIRSGPLQIMISTNGQSPKLANIIRKRIEQGLPEHAGEAIEKVGALRSKLRERAPGVGGEIGKRRMRWMVDVCSSWDMDELALLDEDMMAILLDKGWEKNRVPKLEEVGGQPSKRAPKTAPAQIPAVVLPSALGFSSALHVRHCSSSPAAAELPASEV
ncbi:Siroheme biosynthesis protein met8 [Grifola frondosa]|uniref:precorrin-2 dehydrogenase n=1 Tax=Grifola frondosa TaxID=5627 RepID=A0A1C7MFH2_GRIFR|nr:Siroheme biosynthesis protein met8 [Grifola frondosa]